MYLTAYCITTLGAFCVITMLSRRDDECEKISSLRGLAWHHPILAGVLSLMLFSLAGLPITAGFIGKVYILQAAVSSSLWLPVFVLILSSTIGLFYYLRVISELFVRKEPSLPRVASISGSLALAALTFFVLWLGVCPSWLIFA